MAEIRWDDWRGSFDGRPAMYIKRLGKLFGCRADLHKFVRADDRECFHTHPAWAIRIVLWGGYMEEVRGDEDEYGSYQVWKVGRWPGYIGIVRPSLCHRVDWLKTGVSYSLWLRGPIVADVHLRGVGWPDEMTATKPKAPRHG